MAKARIFGKSDDGSEEAKRVVAIYCPGCKTEHIIATKVPFHNSQGVWGFNNNFEKPTFTPSLLIKTGSFASPGFIDPPEIPPTICHSFITDGRIQFLNDCTHDLKGQTVDLPDIK